MPRCRRLPRGACLGVLAAALAGGCEQDEAKSAPEDQDTGRSGSGGEHADAAPLATDSGRPDSGGPGAEPEPVDADGDGVPAEDDCDDADAARGARATDADCDGVLTADDCDDADPSWGDRGGDLDCDGAPATVDCDDRDPATHPGASGATDALWDNTACEAHLLDTGLFVVEGQAPGDELGYAVTALSDLDGDGRSEVVIGVPGHDEGGTDSGSVYVLMSGQLAGEPGPEVDLSRAVRLEGHTWYEQAGRSVARGGDIDGDGLEDLLVGAPMASVGGVTLAGVVYVVPGAALVGQEGQTVGLGAAAWRIHGNEERMRLGAQVAAAGDVDGDGLDDLLVADETADWGWATGHLLTAATLLGTTERVVDIAAADLHFVDVADMYSDAANLAGVGDLDGDGLAELAVSSDERTGIFLGRSLATGSGASVAVADADHVLDCFSCEAAGVGDVDGDGLGDVALGERSRYYDDHERGMAHVLTGAALATGPAAGTPAASLAALTIEGEPEDRVGARVAPAGDLDGDGLDDVLIVGTPDLPWPTGYGRVLVQLGGRLPPEPLVVSTQAASHAVVAASRWSLFGWSVVSAGDVDGDGRPNLVVAEPRWDPDADGAQRGRVLLLQSGP